MGSCLLALLRALKTSLFKTQAFYLNMFWCLVCRIHMFGLL